MDVWVFVWVKSWGAQALRVLGRRRMMQILYHFLLTLTKPSTVPGQPRELGTARKGQKAHGGERKTAGFAFA